MQISALSISEFHAQISALSVPEVDSQISALSKSEIRDAEICVSISRFDSALWDSEIDTRNRESVFGFPNRYEI